jgi:hypothetical protein
MNDALLRHQFCDEAIYHQKDMTLISFGIQMGKEITIN